MNVQIARILAIDKDPLILPLLRHILEQENYEMLEAATNTEGIQLAQASKPDLILLDLQLPDLSGFNVCRQLKSHKSTQNIPIIFLTGAKGEEIESQGFTEGAVDFISKPITQQLAIARINNALESKFAREQLEHQTSELQKMNSLLKLNIGLQQQTTLNLQQRDAILSTVNFVGAAFLKSRSWKEVIDVVVKELGKTVECEHVYFITMNSMVQEHHCYGWFKNKNTINCSSLDQLTTWKDPQELFASGKPIIGPENTLPAFVLEKLENQNIRSYVIFPVYVAQSLWGCLGFDCSRSDRCWSKTHINALATITDILSSVLYREHESRERIRLAAAIHQFADCVLMTDDNGEIFYANPACKTVTGFSHKELTGINFKELQRDDLQQISGEQILDIAKKTDIWRGHIRNFNKEGSDYDEELSVIPVRDELGKVMNYVIIKRDETEKNRLESIAEAANLMDNVGFVFSGIRHELGNPLNSLKMALSVLSKHQENFSPEKTKEFLNRSMNEINRMEYLLYSLKNFNQYEEQNPVSLDLNAFLENFKRVHQPDLQRKGIDIQFKAMTTGNGLVDERAFHQALLNLTSNSVLALKGRKDPTISILLTKTQRNFKQIRFQDNGCGFPDHVHSQLFKPFFTTRAKGSGLGLTIVKKTLTSMNCTIEIEGTKGVGACIIINIPAG